MVSSQPNPIGSDFMPTVILLLESTTYSNSNPKFKVLSIVYFKTQCIVTVFFLNTLQWVKKEKCI